MKVAVVGLWHLGSVTAACLSQSGHDVVAYDPDANTIHHLENNQPPIFEPGLCELLSSAKRLIFSNDPNDLKQAEVIWITFDTPVDDNDIADTSFVIKQITEIYPYLQDNAIVLISSQLPAGSTRRLQQQCTEAFHDKHITFAYSPENLRLGKAIDVFLKPDRIIVGLEKESQKSIIEKLLSPFSDNIIWMSIESAEMTKHALNAFLATSVVFINELASLCEKTGANAREVERGLKSEERIGPKAYLRPGNAIAGGTLARDVNYLIQLGKQQTIKTPLFSALLDSNHAHKQWSCRRIMDIFKDIKNKTITTLGLTYKAGTDTLRRSTAIETCQWLNAQGATLFAYDPHLTHLPDPLNTIIDLKPSLLDAIQHTDAIIISTECVEFNSLSADQIISLTNNACIFDPGGFLAKLGLDARLKYFSVGKQT